MQKVGQILKNFNPVEDKYISREFQSFGIYLTEQLEDFKHKGLYMRLAKTVHRSILEKALSFVSDSKANNKGALFMWKISQLKAGNTTNNTNTTNSKYKKNFSTSSKNK